jgi:hypothetical protein
MALYLEEFVESVENLPNELRHYLQEVKLRDESVKDLKKQIIMTEKSGNDNKEEALKNLYKSEIELAEEKILIAEKALDLLERHMKRLDESITKTLNSVDEPGISSDLFQSEQKKSRPSLTSARNSGRSMLSSSRSGGQPPSKSFGAPDDDTVYCVCQQGSYGEMIACDNAEKCVSNEWFHYDCVGLSEPPKGTWFCPQCVAKKKNIKKKD